MLLAHANVALLKAPLDAPESRGFAAGLEPMERLATASPGFVWRLEGAGGHLTVDAVWKDRLVLLNVSLWEDYPALHDFVYRSAHVGYLRNARRWFAPLTGTTTVLWWVEDEERPSADSALARLSLLNRYGPSPRAFSLRRQFDSAGVPVRRGRGRRDAAA